MSNNIQAKTPTGDAALEALFVALRGQYDDARISEMIENLKNRNYSKETIVARVMQAVGPDAAVRVQRIAANRAQQMATGTWKRYRMTRSRRFKLWLRDGLETLGKVCRASPRS